MYGDFCSNFFGAVPFVGSYFNPLIWVIIVAVAVSLIYSIFKGKQSLTKSGRTKDESATNILKRRYASGELTEEEFKQMKKDLR